MDDEIQRKIFAKKLNYYLALNKVTQKEVAEHIGVTPQSFNTWCKGNTLPRMAKLQALADYFNINKSDLIDDSDNTQDEIFQKRKLLFDKSATVPPDILDKIIRIIDVLVGDELE